MNGNALIARHVDQSPVVECGVQHSHSVVFRHVDLIKDTKPAVLRGKRDRAAAQPHLAAGEGICADKRAAIGIHMERHSVDRTAEQPRKVVRQDIFARGLAAGEQDILSLQQRGNRQIHDLIADEFDRRLGNAAAHRLVRDILLSKLLQSERQLFSHAVNDPLLCAEFFCAICRLRRRSMRCIIVFLQGLVNLRQKRKPNYEFGVDPFSF